IKGEIHQFSVNLIQEFESDVANSSIDASYDVKDFSDVVSFGPMVLMQAEIVALDVLSNELSETEVKSRRQFFDFVLGLECSRKPVSDNYAISIMLIAIATSKCGGDPGFWLKKVVV